MRSSEGECESSSFAEETAVPIRPLGKVLLWVGDGGKTGFGIFPLPFQPGLDLSRTMSCREFRISVLVIALLEIRVE